MRKGVLILLFILKGCLHPVFAQSDSIPVYHFGMSVRNWIITDVKPNVRHFTPPIWYKDSTFYYTLDNEADTIVMNYVKQTSYRDSIHLEKYDTSLAIKPTYH